MMQRLRAICYYVCHRGQVKTYGDLSTRLSTRRKVSFFVLDIFVAEEER